jgi:hypothetical protein
MENNIISGENFTIKVLTDSEEDSQNNTFINNIINGPIYGFPHGTVSHANNSIIEETEQIELSPASGYTANYRWDDENWKTTTDVVETPDIGDHALSVSFEDGDDNKMIYTYRYYQDGTETTPETPVNGTESDTTESPYPVLAFFITLVVIRRKK